MNKLLIAALVASSALVAPGAVVTSVAVETPTICDGDVPESWRRPGGYCDQLGGKSLIEPGEPTCPPVASLWLPKGARGARIAVAMAMDPCDPCPQVTTFEVKHLPVGDRVRVASC